MAERVSDEGVLETKCAAMMTRYHGLPEGNSQGPDGKMAIIEPAMFSAAMKTAFSFFVGRADDMFVCGGENIYPGEVEKILERPSRVSIKPRVIPVADELKGTEADCLRRKDDRRQT